MLMAWFTNPRRLCELGKYGLRVLEHGSFLVGYAPCVSLAMARLFVLGHRWFIFP